MTRYGVRVAKWIEDVEGETKNVLDVEVGKELEAMSFRIRSCGSPASGQTPRSKSKAKKGEIMKITTARNAVTTWLPALTLTISSDDDTVHFTESIDANSNGVYVFEMLEKVDNVGGGGGFRFPHAGEWNITIHLEKDDVTASATEGTRHRFFAALSETKGFFVRTVHVVAPLQRWRLAPHRSSRALASHVTLRRGAKFKFDAFPETGEGIKVGLNEVEAAQLVPRFAGECNAMFGRISVVRVTSKCVTLETAVRVDAPLDASVSESGSASGRSGGAQHELAFAMARRTKGDDQPVYKWEFQSAATALSQIALSQRLVLFKGLQGDAAADIEYPRVDTPYRFDKLADDALRAGAVMELHSSDGGVAFSIVSGPPAQIELISVDGRDAGSSIPITRGGRPLKLAFRIYDANGDDFTVRGDDECSVRYTAVDMQQQIHPLTAGETEHVCSLDAYAPFGDEIEVEVALMISGKRVARTSVLCTVAKAILRFVRNVKRKKQVASGTLAIVGSGDDMPFAVEIWYETATGEYERAKNAVRGDGEEGCVLGVGDAGPCKIPFEFASNGMGHVALPREPGTMEWTACFGAGGASLESAKLTIVVEEEDAPFAEATLWAFENRDASSMALRPEERGALREALVVQLRGSDGEAYAGDSTADKVWLKFAPSGAKGGRRAFIVELTCDANASPLERRWLVPEDAVLDEGTAGAAPEVGQKWLVSVVSEGGVPGAKKLKTEKRTIEIAAGAPHHLEIEWTNTPVGECLQRRVGPLALAVAVVDCRGNAVAASALGRWHLTVVVEECNDDETQPPTMSVPRSEYTVTPARGGSAAEKRAVSQIKACTLANSDEALLFENFGVEGTWYLPPLLLDVGSGGGASDAAYASESNRVRVMIATRSTTAPRGKKKKRARRSAAAKANDAVSLSGSITLKLAHSDRIVGLESIEENPVIEGRTIADGFPTFEYLLKTDGPTEGENVAIDLAKVEWSVAPTLKDGDEIFDVVSAGDGVPGFRLVAKRSAPRARPGHYRVTSSYTEDRYAVVDPYSVDNVREVRLRAGPPVALVRSSSGRATLDASNAEGRRAIFAGELVLQLHDVDGYVSAVAASAAGRPLDVLLSLRKCGGCLRTASSAAEGKQAPQLEQKQGRMERGEVRWNAIQIAKGSEGTQEGEYELMARVNIAGRVLELKVAKFQYSVALGEEEDKAQEWKDKKKAAERRLSERDAIEQRLQSIDDECSQKERALEKLRALKQDSQRELQAFEEQFGPREDLERQVKEMTLRLESSATGGGQSSDSRRRGDGGEPMQKRARGSERRK